MYRTALKLLAAAQDHDAAKKFVPVHESLSSREPIAEGQKLVRHFKPRQPPPPASRARAVCRNAALEVKALIEGTGFFITADGYLVTSEHVLGEATDVRVLTGAGLKAARVLKTDAADDLALRKLEGRFATLPVASSRPVKLGAAVATVGFPNIGLQGFAPKLARGEIASLARAADDSRHFQIRVPVQLGNSGGARGTPGATSSALSRRS